MSPREVLSQDTKIVINISSRSSALKSQRQISYFLVNVSLWQKPLCKISDSFSLQELTQKANLGIAKNCDNEINKRSLNIIVLHNNHEIM